MGRHQPINFLERETQKVTPHKSGLIFFLLFLIVLFIAGGCVRQAWNPVDIPTDPEAYDPVTLEPKQPEGLLARLKHFVFSKDITLEGERKDRINILLLGQGGPGHDGPYLTDTILLVSVKPSTGNVAFTSIPRDLYVDIPGYGRQKINHANAFGESDGAGKGPELTKQVIEQTFQQEINYYVRVDFRAFEKLIDLLGGVRVYVDRSFTDSEYPAANYAYQVVSFKKGPQTMDGDTALKFVRSRHGNNGEGSDFARAKRQQKVIVALKEKLLSFDTLTSPTKIKDILETLGDHVVTDVDFGNSLQFIKTARNVATDNVITFPLTTAEDGHLVSGTSAQGAFILLPRTGNFDAINDSIERIFENPPEVDVAYVPEQNSPPPIEKTPEPSQVIEETAPKAAQDDIPEDALLVEVQNGTWRAGLAARQQKRLQDLGFVVKQVGNTQLRPQLTSAIYLVQDHEDSEKIVALAEALQIPVGTSIPESEEPNPNSHILVILGEDFVE